MLRTSFSIVLLLALGLVSVVPAPALADAGCQPKGCCCGEGGGCAMPEAPQVDCACETPVAEREADREERGPQLEGAALESSDARQPVARAERADRAKPTPTAPTYLRHCAILC